MSIHIRVSARAVILSDSRALLVEYNDETGLHYNLPGGGAEPGESLHEALQREVCEETSAEIEPGELLWVVEYEPQRNCLWAGPVPSMSFIFSASLKPGSMPHLPEHPDPDETAVRWVNLAELDTIELLPFIGSHIQRWAAGGTRESLLLEEPIDPIRILRYLKG